MIIFYRFIFIFIFLYLFLVACDKWTSTNELDNDLQNENNWDFQWKLSFQGAASVLRKLILPTEILLKII